MTSLPPSRPLAPTLQRMALGLGLSALGATLFWQGAPRSLTPGMSVQDTPLSVPLDGPLPLDLASSAALTLEGDRVDVTVAPLEPGSAQVVRGRAHHRARNAIQADVARDGRRVTARVALSVQPINAGVILNGPEGVQHTLDLALTRRIPLALTASTTSGMQILDLTPLRVQNLTLRSVSGDLALTLPQRETGPVSVTTGSGQVSVTGPAGSVPAALRVNTRSGSQALHLAGARTRDLSVGSDSGDVRLTLPGVSGRASVTTGSGNVTVTALPGTRGNLDIRTQSGQVTLRIPPTLSARIRFTDRATLTLPRGARPDPSPALDVFVDAPRSSFTLPDLEDTP
ncbi:DUF4097 domain-containing protein [Deinococcus taeanensis]|uniref:DUF4097 family beta strand repeat-containing protein n=1 Tax=Deinococcus taeanensis TaxID=2737050 RepID=UPI001CDC8054|nr:DUF4097 family beta strand repeat-containing protein [Deinococcus taeanensis]UBV43344.1 DUF4097 domain-containing protein [Deinococcus taeanensis]